jgi:hypothetical protein
MEDAAKQSTGKKWEDEGKILSSLQALKLKTKK